MGISRVFLVKNYREFGQNWRNSGKSLLLNYFFFCGNFFCYYRSNLISSCIDILGCLYMDPVTQSFTFFMISKNIGSSFCVLYKLLDHSKPCSPNQWKHTESSLLFQLKFLHCYVFKVNVY